MLLNMKELLSVAQEEKFAVPAFNIGSVQLLKAVLKGAKECNSPVILEFSPDEFNFMNDAGLDSCVMEAMKSDLPIVLHLDHGKTFEDAAKAIKAGFTSVMIDASHMSYEENIEITKKVVELAKSVNVSVESELGTIGLVDNSIEGGSSDIIYTDPNQAKDFIDKTGIDTLAVAIGTAHGIYPKDKKPELRLDILDEITKSITIPLVLHGGSSNKDEELSKAINKGICKINISSDIKVAFYEECRKVLNNNTGYREPLEIYPSSIEACKNVVVDKINLFNSQNKAGLYY